MVRLHVGNGAEEVLSLCSFSVRLVITFNPPDFNVCVIARYICFIYCRLPNTNTATACHINPLLLVPLP